MKRHAALLKLSREHHVALVLAKRIVDAADADAMEELMAAVPTTFRSEIEPHFHAEETVLLPLLADAGEGALVRRTVEEHRLLRRLAANIAHGDRDSLKPFGNALRAHVRFEERELFTAVEAMLPTFTGAAAQFQQSAQGGAP